MGDKSEIMRVENSRVHHAGEVVGDKWRGQVGNKCEVGNKCGIMRTRARRACKVY